MVKAAKTVICTLLASAAIAQDGESPQVVKRQAPVPDSGGAHIEAAPQLPGIAKALLATGIGQVAANPVVLLYNRFLRRIVAFRQGWPTAQPSFCFASAARWTRA